MKIISLVLCISFFLDLFQIIFPMGACSQTATVPISITVNGTLTISDSNNDTSSGKNPTINVNLAVTPDLGAAEVVGDANFRVRTNRPNWRLVAQRTSEVDTGPTNIKPTDVGLLVTTQVGSKADPNSGTLVAPFNAKTDLSRISTSSPVVVIKGSKKTSLERDKENKNNYFQVNTRYSIFPDFFYQPGTWKTTITYNLVSP